MRDFCEQVLAQMTRATRREKRAVRAELTDHMADHAAALEGQGYSREEARARAAEAMGDPAEIGRALNAQLSPFWLWLGRGARALTALVCLLLLYNSPLLEWCLRETVQVRWGTVEEYRDRPSQLEYLAGRGYTAIRDVDVRGTLGGDVVRVSRVYLDPTPGRERAGAWVLVYPKNPLDTAPRIEFYDIELYSCLGGGQGGSFAAQATSDIYCVGEILDVPVTLGDEYMVLRWERFGETLELSIPLDWEVEP